MAPVTAYADVVAALRAEPDFARLLAIREIGPWTVEMLALHGLGRLDVVPAGDLGYLKLVGRLLTGDPKAVRRRGRGARVLRALRAVCRPRRELSHPRADDPRPSPGRNSLVSGGASEGGRLSSWFARIQRS